jgi:hypothetical protein
MPPLPAASRERASLPRPCCVTCIVRVRQEEERFHAVVGKHDVLGADPALTIDQLRAAAFSQGPDQLWSWFSELANTVVSDVGELMDPRSRLTRISPSGRNDVASLEPWAIIQTEIPGKHKASIFLLFAWYASEEGTAPNILAASSMLTSTQRGLSRSNDHVQPRPPPRTPRAPVVADPAAAVISRAEGLLSMLGGSPVMASPNQSRCQSRCDSDSMLSSASSHRAGSRVSVLDALEQRVELLNTKLFQVSHPMVKESVSLQLREAEYELRAAMAREFADADRPPAPPMMAAPPPPMMAPPPFPPPGPPPPSSAAMSAPAVPVELSASAPADAERTGGWAGSSMPPYQHYYPATSAFQPHMPAAAGSVSFMGYSATAHAFDPGTLG